MLAGFLQIKIKKSRECKCKCTSSQTESHFTESVQNHYQAELKKNEAGLTFVWFHSITA